MKNNNSTKKTVTILSLAMVLVLPVTSHADEQTNEEKPLNTQNYMGGGTDSKLEEELSALIDKEKADDKEVSIDKESSDEIESSDIETSNSNIEDKENLAETEDTLDKNDNEELEISNEFNESQLRATNPSRDISNKLQDVDIKIYDTEERGKLKSVDGEDLGWSISFKAPTDVQPGDEFTITLSDNWSLKGIEPDTDFADPIIDENGVVIAEGKRTDRNHIVYTFTENIRGGEEISGKINSHGYDVKEKIKNTQDQTFEISVGDKSNNKTLTVDYGPINVSDNWNANGKSQFISNDEKTGEYKQVFYINPNKETITASDNHNISFYIDGVYGEDGDWKKLLYPQDNTTVTVNKVSQNETLPDAVYENPVNYDGDSDTDVIYNFNDTGDIVVDFKSQSIDSSYVVTVTSKAPAGIGPYTLLSKGTIYGNPQKEENLVLGNGIINRGGDASGTNIKKRGSFKETHVYITKDFEGNVVEDKTIIEPGKSSEGTKEESYTSAKVDKDGYVFTKVTADEGSDEVTISEDGKSVESGNYVEDKNLSVTYEYVKQPGRFVEHHIYKTVDKDGNEVSIDKTVNNPKEGEPAKEGFSNEKITTAQRPEDGYSYDSETTLESENYVPGKTLEKTYVYVKTQEDPEKPVTPEKPGTSEDPEKPVTPEKPGNPEDPKKPVTPETPEKPEVPETPEKPEVPETPEKPETPETPDEPVEEKGSFQEHHVYITKDENGKEITREKVDGKESEGTIHEFYNTGKKRKRWI